MRMNGNNDCVAIIVAAGKGERAGPGMAKQYRKVGGRPVIAKAVAAFLDNPAVDCVLVVIGQDDEALYRSAVGAHPKLASPVIGGSSRQQSVLNGLRVLAGKEFRNVLTHDAARAFVDRETIDRVADGLATSQAVIPCQPVSSTLKQVD